MNKVIGSRLGSRARLMVGAMGLAAVVSSASALDFSVGGGGFFASDFGGSGTHTDDYKTNSGNVTTRWNRREAMPWLGGGFGVFFDAAYAEVGLGLTFAGGSPYVELKKDYGVGNDTSYTNDDIGYSMTYLNISVLGKLPMSLGDNSALYPLFGIDYNLCVAGSTDVTLGNNTNTSKWDGKGSNPKAGDFSQLWLKFGLGYDHGLSDKLFLRSQALYGIGFSNKSANDEAEAKDYSTNLSHGLTVKVGVGFRL